MSEFTATVTDFTERKGSFSPVRTPGRTLGAIVVKPPIQAGEGFKNAVLGQNSHLVDVQHVVTTDEASVFVAESGRGEAENRQADIHAIADRIGRLANAPHTVLQMLDSNPFAHS
jgi:hypothetical protein